MKLLNRFLVLFFGLALITNSAFGAQTLFDGYYRLKLNDKPIGYMILVYRYDEKAKNFEHFSFLKTGKLGGDIQESLKATSNEKLEPVSYAYTSKAGDHLKTIDATFKGEIMQVAITDGKTKQENKTFKNPEGSFLASFLIYLMLQKGISVGTKFSYKGIAEEDGNNYNGEAWIKEKTNYNSVQAFKVYNKFKGEEFISFLNDKGEVLGTLSPSKKLTAELMASPAAATKDFIVPHKTLSLLFGSIPTGSKNMFHNSNDKAKLNSPIPSPDSGEKELKSSRPASSKAESKNSASTSSNSDPKALKETPAKKTEPEKETSN